MTIDQNRLREFEKRQLHKIELVDDITCDATLEFIDDNGTSSFIRLKNCVYFCQSRSLDDDGTYVIGEVKIQRLSRDEIAENRSINFGFSKGGKPCIGADDIIWVHIEGMIVLDVLCEAYDLELH